MLKFRWPWYIEIDDVQREISVKAISGHVEIELKWEEVAKVPPEDNIVGKCVFCTRDIVQMEDHFHLTEAAGQRSKCLASIWWKMKDNFCSCLNPWYRDMLRSPFCAKCQKPIVRKLNALLGQPAGTKGDGG